MNLVKGSECPILGLQSFEDPCCTPYPQARLTGVNVMMPIFGDFVQFLANKIGAFCLQSTL
jgi:hypothetical protein